MGTGIRRRASEGRLHVSAAVAEGDRGKGGARICSELSEVMDVEYLAVRGEACDHVAGEG